MGAYEVTSMISVFSGGDFLRGEALLWYHALRLSTQILDDASDGRAAIPVMSLEASSATTSVVDDPAAPCDGAQVAGWKMLGRSTMATPRMLSSRKTTMRVMSISSGGAPCAASSRYMFFWKFLVTRISSVARVYEV